ncbi:MAG: 1,2-phenylacetyl-CoA epoxidase subunit PaaC [Actinomycetota bacterium]|nr:phenylacetate-CoA oxygenase subunit PaaC [Actinomycetota bacterium]
MDDARLTLLLAIADDEMVTGHRLGEWTGWVPYIEEDLALSSIAQDEIGHAKALYELAADLGAAPSADALAFGRRADQYRHAVLCERSNKDFAYTIARHYLYDTADEIRLGGLSQSSFKELVQLFTVFRPEERYHTVHARTWFSRLADGPVDAKHRFSEALASLMGEAVALFEPLPAEESLREDGTMPVPSEQMLGRWLDGVTRDLESFGLERVLEERSEPAIGDLVPTSSGAAEESGDAARLRVPGIERQDGRWVHTGGFEGAGGRRGHHSEEFAPLWEEMTNLYRTHPGATW